MIFRVIDVFSHDKPHDILTSLRNRIPAIKYDLVLLVFSGSKNLYPKRQCMIKVDFVELRKRDDELQGVSVHRNTSEGKKLPNIYTKIPVFLYYQNCSEIKIKISSCSITGHFFFFSLLAQRNAMRFWGTWHLD